MSVEEKKATAKPAVSPKVQQEAVAKVPRELSYRCMECGSQIIARGKITISLPILLCPDHVTEV